jgi:hypothetical protein
MTTEIQCRCGAVHVEVSGEPVAQFFCHCDDCQAVHGGAYIPVALYPQAAVKVTRGEPRSWKLKTMARYSCPECGTRMFAGPPGIGMFGIPAMLLPAGSFQPTFHAHCRFAVRPVKDDLLHYKDLPEHWGGSGDPVGW